MVYKYHFLPIFIPKLTAMDVVLFTKGSFPMSGAIQILIKEVWIILKFLTQPKIAENGVALHIAIAIPNQYIHNVNII